MPEELWQSVDHYITNLFALEDSALLDALADSEASGLPPINVAANQGRMLELLATVSGARRILEIGTLGGYSTIWLARALGPGGVLVSLELDERHASVARSNVARAGFADVVEVLVGPASTSLRQLVAERTAPFDFIFIDADKESYPDYFEQSLLLAHAGSLIVADNVVRGGEVVNEHATDERVIAVRTFLELAAAHPRVRGTAIQTVGVKGHDGFALLYVTA